MKILSGCRSEQDRFAQCENNVNTECSPERAGDISSFLTPDQHSTAGGVKTSMVDFDHVHNSCHSQP